MAKSKTTPRATKAPKAIDPIKDELLDTPEEPIDELMDTVIGATVTDGEYRATLKDVRPIITSYNVEETVIEAGIKKTTLVPRIGKVYNFTWILQDGRTLIDPRFTRESDDPAKKYQSVNIAIGNIATQLGKTTLTLRQLLELKPTLTVWVSRVGKNRNVDYLKPIIRAKAVNMAEDNAPL